MNVFQLLKAELAKLSEKKGVLLSVIAVLLIPIVYAAILLSPTWSPYDNLSNLPVAVVNLDKGAMSGEEPVHAGDDLVANLKESMSLGFEFVSKDEAEKGMERQDYYMIIEIPEDFSEKITTVMDENPKIPELRYVQNEGLNYMASQVTNSAMERIREQLGNSITETYAKNVFKQLGDIASGFQTAAEGSEKIYSGSSKLNDGTNTIVNSLVEKAPDIEKLADGAKVLNNGLHELNSTVASKQSDIAKLAAGAKTANEGAAEILSNLKNKSNDIAALANGSKVLANGLSDLLSNLTTKENDITTLAEGSKELSEGVKELSMKVTAAAPSITELHEGAQKLNDSGPLLQGGSEQILAGLKNIQGSVNNQLVPGSQQLNAGIGNLNNSAQQLASFSSQLAAALNNYLQHPLLADDPTFHQLVELSNGISNGLTTMSQGINEQIKPGMEALTSGIFNVQDDPTNPQTLKYGIDALVAGKTNLNTKINDELVPGFAQLAAGTTVLNASWNEMLVKIPIMADGASKIAAGNETVDGGWKALKDGAGKLNIGASTISDGNQTVNAGWQALTSGVTQLYAGTTEIANGNATVKTGWDQIVSGSSQLYAGSSQISDGTQTVKTGWGDLTAGASQINDGVGQIKDGSNELATKLGEGAKQTSAINVSDKNTSMFSSPVKTVGEKVNSYEYYRDSTAPFIISLALFVGMLIMSFIVDFKKPVDYPASKMSWFASKYLQLSIFAISQALLVSIFALLVLQLKVTNVVSFTLFSVFVSMTFMTIIFFLVASAGNIGRFIAFAFIVAQLSITGSNLPVEMLPEFHRSLSQYLPLTYSNAGFRATISLNDSSYLLSNAGILFIYFAIFAVLACSVFMFSNNKATEDISISK